MSNKKQCPNCLEYPAWNKGFSDTVLRVNPVYLCGLCSFELPRTTRKTKASVALETFIKSTKE